MQLAENICLICDKGLPFNVERGRVESTEP